MATPFDDLSTHPSDLELAAYLDRTTSAVHRDRIESHLAECAECRRHFVAARDVARASRRPSRLVLGSFAAAAASVLVAVTIVSQRESASPRTPVDRGSATASATLIAYGPLGQSMADTVRFVWGAVPAVLSYHLTVTRSDGVTVWSHNGVDTSVALPSSVRLTPSQRYLWTADALLADGDSRSTGIREFMRTR